MSELKKFNARDVLPLSKNAGDFILPSTQNNVKLVAPNILLSEDQILFLTDFHMQSELERFGIESDGEEVFVSNFGDDNTTLDEAVYFGSALDFLHYESIVYTLSKYEFFLRTFPSYSPKNIILNEKMSKNTRDWLIADIKKRFPQCNLFLMNANKLFEIGELCVFALNDSLINSNLELLSSFIKTLVPAYSKYENSKSKLLMARKQHVYFDFKSRKPRNSRLFEWYARFKGFCVFDPGKMSFMDVLERMANASLVVSYHGGALVNVLACKPGTKIVEIYSEWYADCYAQISKKSKLEYINYFYEMKKRPDRMRNLYYLLFNIDKQASKKHFRIRYRDFSTILQDHIG